MSTQYHYKNTQPFEYVKDNKTYLSSLATDIEELYPPNWIHEHGENAKKAFQEKPVGERYQHLWSSSCLGSKKRTSLSPAVTCIVCMEAKKVEYQKDGMTLNLKNLMKHIAVQHPQFLTVEDREKYSKEEQPKSINEYFPHCKN